MNKKDNRVKKRPS